MDVYDEIVSKADRLSVAEKVRLLEHLSTALRHDLEVEAFQRMPWREFIERTAGILSDDPIERPPQPPLEEREMLE
ncbi:MAG: hypothetical protein IT319_00260 [Anaerolineae bacterium]|nr:hypothetical protein [Anaerolineae bacterium]